MAEQSLKDKAAKGLFWGGVSNGLQQVLGMLFGIFLARILSVDDYGLDKATNSTRPKKRAIRGAARNKTTYDKLPAIRLNQKTAL